MAFATARALTTTREDAEDACQDAFTRGFFRLDTCREPERFGAWIGQIVRRRAHNLRSYQALRRCAALDTIAEPSSSAATDDVTMRSALERALATALAQLPPMKRAVVLRFDVDGWTHEQIAEELGTSVLMSRRHLSDARKQLRGILLDLGYGDDDE